MKLKFIFILQIYQQGVSTMGSGIWNWILFHLILLTIGMLIFHRLLPPTYLLIAKSSYKPPMQVQHFLKHTSSALNCPWLHPLINPWKAVLALNYPYLPCICHLSNVHKCWLECSLSLSGNKLCVYRVVVAMGEEESRSLV